ncbi:UbiA prenyltransferase family-domain-containing protein [Xylariaceae sp. FL0804]|nr:UbiA prenyltransferase family-domain-containing protein [Xylariaceae sp. FL0804]
MSRLFPEKVDKQRTSLTYHLKTLFLFTKSDIKTIIIPQSIFAVATAAPGIQHLPQTARNLSGLFSMLIWVWLHLLVHNIANQRLPGSILEDKENKPFRPIPAGRITPAQALRLLRIVVPVAVSLSFLLGGLLPSVSLMTLVWMYNDLGAADAGPFQRNTMNALGYACYGWGAVAMLGYDLGAEDSLGRQVSLWIALIALVTASTVYAQDFPDMAGDRARGRRSVPLLYGEAYPRAALAALAVFWSITCPLFWNATPVAWIGPVLVGGIMATMTLWYRTQAANELVWKLWSAWITSIYLIPLFRQ